MNTVTDRIAGVSGALAVKAPVIAATTADITLSGEQTIDGVAVVADDRVLVKNQTNAVENGIYDVTSTAWSRSKDFNGARDAVTGTQVWDNNGATYYRVATASNIIIGTTAITFSVSSLVEVTGFTTPEDHGATGVAGTDASLAIKTAFATGKLVIFENQYTINTSMISLVASRGLGLPGHKIIPSLGLDGGKVCAFPATDVEMDDLIFDAAGETFTTVLDNTYCIFGGDGVTKYTNHRYTGIKILNMSFSDGEVGNSNLLVSHAIYVDNVNGVEIGGCTIDTLSGACVFLRDVEHFTVRFNTFEDNRWYTINIVEGCKHGDVGYNRFLSGTPEGVYWGGAINTVSDQGLVKNSHIIFHHNYFTGVYSYGGVIRLQSSDHAVVEYNELEDLSVGTANSANDLTGIRTVTRGISASVKAEPCQNIVIRHNILHGPSTVTGKRHAIYISNEWWAASNPSYNYQIYGNMIYSPDATNYWEDAIIAHGQDGGIEELWVEDNYAEVRSATGAAVGGAIGFIGNSADGTVDHIREGGNTVIEMGTAADAWQYGLGFNAYCDNVVNTKPNRLKNHFYGVRTLANAGPTLDKIDDQKFDTCTADTLFAVAPSRYGVPLEATTAYDPPSLADGATTTKDVTVTGAALGDLAAASFTLDQAGVEFTAYVRVADSVRVILNNTSGGTVDLGSGTLKVRVAK